MKVGHYITLNIEHDASEIEVKKAFHRLAHIHHPDKNGGKDTEFKKINAAYIIISNPQKRQDYDISIGIRRVVPHQMHHNFNTINDDNFNVQWTVRWNGNGTGFY